MAWHYVRLWQPWQGDVCRRRRKETVVDEMRQTGQLSGVSGDVASWTVEAAGCPGYLGSEPQSLQPRVTAFSAPTRFGLRL